jgi:predicted DCC family thiol-disulfide oxidoreductase YuxK
MSTILFDGVCNLCNGFVQFVLARDPCRRFKFGSLQSEAAQKLLARHVHSDIGVGLESIPLSSVILLEDDGRIYRESAAVLRVLKGLSGLWPLMYAFVIIPAPIRDRVYRWIARNRYRWFGKRDQCMLPTPEVRDRFI